MTTTTGTRVELQLIDADLDAAAAAIVVGITLTTGQICAAGSRVVVERSVHAELAGQVAVNAALGAGVIGGPFGGYQRSGFGRTMGADAVLESTQVKTVSFRG